MLHTKHLNAWIVLCSINKMALLALLAYTCDSVKSVNNEQLCRLSPFRFYCSQFFRCKHAFILLSFAFAFKCHHFQSTQSIHICRKWFIQMNQRELCVRQPNEWWHESALEFFPYVSPCSLILQFYLRKRIHVRVLTEWKKQKKTDVHNVAKWCRACCVQCV